jgi:hypothetical protein
MPAARKETRTIAKNIPFKGEASDVGLQEAVATSQCPRFAAIRIEPSIANEMGFRGTRRLLTVASRFNITGKAAIFNSLVDL